MSSNNNPNNDTCSTNDELPTKITTMSEYEKRMEVNRLRAKEIRKRKKKMEEDMRQQIVQLTLENNRLRIQKKMQEVEIERLRKERYQQQSAMMMFNQPGINPMMQLGGLSHTALNPIGIPSTNDVGFLPGGGVDAVRHQMLASLSGEDGSSVAAPPGAGGMPVVSQQVANKALTGNSSPEQVEAALRYDQALLNQLANMQGGTTGAARMMALQNHQAARVGTAPDATGGVEASLGVVGGNDQNQQIMNLLSDRSLTVQEGILKKLQEQSKKAK